MILIADCGSTKTDWCVVNGTEIVNRVKTIGMNAMLMTSEEIYETIKRELMPQIDATGITEVYFYGAGCLGDQVLNNVKNAIYKNIPAERIEVASDLLAVARALCGKEPGIACILGTGSNSCFYDGKEIVENVSPLGYILGDEGSGAVLGKILVGDVLKCQLPEHLCKKFLEQYNLDRLTIIQRVYKEPAANRFLASLSPFLLENIEEPSIHRLVLNAFKSFFVRNIENYTNYKQYKANFIGSIAVYYRSVLEEAADTFGMELGIVAKSPMEGLIKYHTA